MPSILSTSPFVSLRPDAGCGRQQHSNGSTENELVHRQKASTNGVTNGDRPEANGSASESDDEFLRLSKPQQDVLLLKGPAQRYSLEQAQDVPDLKHDREILVQVLAIGLNPVDWKGPDYGKVRRNLLFPAPRLTGPGFGQPSYPWINGRDFAGIVVRESRKPSRIKTGDVVFGPSTDYRDVRKAAYQEYVVTTDCNVARVTPETTVKGGAALGVAFVAASVALGISFGLDFGYLKNTPSGPDLYEFVRQYQRQIPEDVKNECLSNLEPEERLSRGEWLAIWGGKSEPVSGCLLPCLQ